MSEVDVRREVLEEAHQDARLVTFLYSGSCSAGLPESGRVSDVQDTYLTTEGGDVVPLELLYGITYSTQVTKDWGSEGEE